MDKVDYIQNQTIDDLCKDSLVNTRKLFISNFGLKVPDFTDSTKLRLMVKINDEYSSTKKLNQQEQLKEDAKLIAQTLQQQQIAQQMAQIQELEARQLSEQQQQSQQLQQQLQTSGQSKPKDPRLKIQVAQQTAQQVTKSSIQSKSAIEKLLEDLPLEQQEKLSSLPKQFLLFENNAKKLDSNSQMLRITQNGENPDNKQTNKQLLGQKQEEIEEEEEGKEEIKGNENHQLSVYSESEAQRNMMLNTVRLGTALSQKINKVIKPEWHRPWKLKKVLPGHRGWVRCIAIDPANNFFVTGSSDRTIKFWDIVTGQCKLTLPGHISAVRSIIISSRHPYMFSCGEDKQVKCWDLEMNQVVRQYHGHLSGVYSLTLHPTLDILASGGRDAVVRLWDMRQRTQIHVLGGHEHTVTSLISQEYEPQLISGSNDSTIRIWDIAAGKSLSTLTNHKKSIRALLFHHKEYTFCSGAADNIKVWKCPEGMFLRNFSGHNAIINTLALNLDNVLVSGADNGSMKFWDWKSGYNFQTITSPPQPGSIAAENGIFCAAFDQSSLRLFTGECDKTIKIYQEDETATPETHPLQTNYKIEFDRPV